MKICSVDGCEAATHARGMCKKHDRRVKKHGDPEGGKINYSSREEAFLARQVAAGGGCINWTGAKTAEGYGRMRGEGETVRAHRYAWSRVWGPIPDGMVIDHVCGNPACVNVEHLRMATPKQNSEHRVREPIAKSGFRGVHAMRDKWQVTVKHNGKKYRGGTFLTPTEANDAAVALRNKLFTHNDRDRANV